MKRHPPGNNLTPILILAAVAYAAVLILGLNHPKAGQTPPTTTTFIAGHDPLYGVTCAGITAGGSHMPPGSTVAVALVGAQYTTFTWTTQESKVETITVANPDPTITHHYTITWTSPDQQFPIVEGDIKPCPASTPSTTPSSSSSQPASTSPTSTVTSAPSSAPASSPISLITPSTTPTTAAPAPPSTAVSTTPPSHTNTIDCHGLTSQGDGWPHDVSIRVEINGSTILAYEGADHWYVHSDTPGPYHYLISWSSAAGDVHLEGDQAACPVAATSVAPVVRGTLPPTR